jgi:hypothetical protein
MDWFTVDKAGLAKLLDKKGKAFAVFELIQNGWDTSAKNVQVTITPVPGKARVTLKVEDDDPEGFKNLTHAFTLFAESEKKGDPSKRGRFNLGEKLVLALCDEASVVSTKGSVVFDAEGRHESRRKRDTGSVFQGVMRMTREELAEVEAAVQRLIPPIGCGTVFNGTALPSREVLRKFEATLPTDISDEEGYLRRTQRKTEVTIHEVQKDETATLYEMGIPVVELSGGEPWHVNVHQKIPLNVDRDNVTPAYLQTVRVLLANEMKDSLSKEGADQVWVNAATEDERIDSQAVETVLDHRFGKKRAIFDASDPEANKQLMNEGFSIIHGGSLSKGQWNNVRDAGLAIPSGQLRPSGVQYDPDGDLEKIIPEDQWTNGIKAVVEMAKDLAETLIGKTIHVKIVNEPISLPHGAWYGNGTLAFNVGRLGKAWFNENPPGPKHLELILHELAHDRVKDHLTKEFADEVGRLAVKLLGKLLSESNFLKYHGYVP